MAWLPEIRRTPSRFRNPIGKYMIYRGPSCIHCGLCADLCPTGVHQRLGKKMLAPKHEQCIGPSCREKDFYCLTRCPQGALRMARNPSLQAAGDFRWPADLLLATWQQAETGTVPYTDLEYRMGNSGGGFDRIRFCFPEKGERFSATHEEISLAIELNRRRDGRPLGLLCVCIGSVRQRPVCGGRIHHGGRERGQSRCQVEREQLERTRRGDG